MGKSSIVTQYRIDESQRADTTKKRTLGLITKSLEIANMADVDIITIIRINPKLGKGGGIHYMTNIEDPSEFIDDINKQKNENHFHYYDLNNYKRRNREHLIDCNDDLVTVRPVNCEPLSPDESMRALQDKMYAKNYDVEAEYAYNEPLFAAGLMTKKQKAHMERQKRRAEVGLPNPKYVPKPRNQRMKRSMQILNTVSSLSKIKRRSKEPRSKRKRNIEEITRESEQEDMEDDVIEIRRKRPIYSVPNYEPGTYTPNLKYGTKRFFFIQLYDVYLTYLDFFGLPSPSTFHFLPLRPEDLNVRNNMDNLMSIPSTPQMNLDVMKLLDHVASMPDGNIKAPMPVSRRESFRSRMQIMNPKLNVPNKDWTLESHTRVVSVNPERSAMLPSV